MGSRLHLLTLRGNHVKELKITVEIIMPGRYMEIKSKHFWQAENTINKGSTLLSPPYRGPIDHGGLPLDRGVPLIDPGQCSKPKQVGVGK